MKDIRNQWKALAADRKITREDITALCLYRALVREQGKPGAIARLSRSFRAITNPTKLANGAEPLGSLETSLWRIRNSTLFSWLEKPEQDQMLAFAREFKITGQEIA